MNNTEFITVLIDFYKELYAISHNKFQMTITPKNIPHFSEKLELLEMSITLMYHKFDRNKSISIGVFLVQPTIINNGNNK